MLDHRAEHDHGDGGRHRHSPLESIEHVHGGSPVLDIGGDIGAMVATMDPDAEGTELHLRSDHDPPISIHTGVWQRLLGEESVTAAVFAELLAGTYWVLAGDGSAVRRVEITGGELTTLDLRAAPRS